MRAFCLKIKIKHRAKIHAVLVVLEATLLLFTLGTDVHDALIVVLVDSSHGSEHDHRYGHYSDDNPHSTASFWLVPLSFLLLLFF